MNILITPDVPEWAIGNLTEEIVKHNKRFNFFNVPVHPRGIMDGVKEIKKILDENEIHFWHAQYWNSAIQMVLVEPRLKKIPSLLTHHNHSSLEKSDWNDFTAVNEMTKWGTDKLKEITKAKVYQIPHGIDLDLYSFIEEYPPKEPAIGYIGRVLPHKNLAEICKTAQRLGYKVKGCGYIDKPDYWERVPKDNLEFNGGLGRQGMMPPSFEREIYRQMTVFVMYSTDEVESGTLPLLEAMARGVPVLATKQGMARDIIEDGKNGILFEPHEFEEKLKMLMEDGELREELRQNAWQTIKNFPAERMAWNYGKTYYDILYPDQKLASVIIPTCNRAESLVETLLSIDAQEYPAKEIIVCDDGSTDYTAKAVHAVKERIETPILYLKTGDKYEYGLARARNRGAIEAMGEILVFLDDRYTMEEGCLQKIVDTAQHGRFMFGRKIIGGKPSNKKSFVENFSWIMKKDFMQAGMFCERMNIYGGLSQETRERFYAQRYTMEQAPEALVKEVVGSPRRKKRDEVWKAKFLLHKMYG